jgi:hypothetical protein
LTELDEVSILLVCDTASLGYFIPCVSRQASGLIGKGHKVLITLEEYSGLIFKGHNVLITLERKANSLSQIVRNPTPSNAASHRIKTDWPAAKTLKAALLS